uniref:hypothetical protein n=1 Tax=Trichocoleus desertorum TaxID=1481672 RepID=UPI0025B60B5B|nr:hypothetical protein [Trichocoleus desertorum]
MITHQPSISQSSETGRNSEIQRQVAEEQRQAAEQQRQQAEIQRGLAAQQFLQAAAHYEASEQQRLISEESRASAEAKRIESEALRAKAEVERIESEAQRQMSEQLRISAESLRQATEEARQVAEATRQAAETLRQTAEEVRQSTLEQQLVLEEMRHTSEKLDRLLGRGSDRKILMNEKQNSSPMILMVEPDDETRPLLKYNLKHQGYRVIAALDEEDAIERLMGGFHCPDLILLNQFGQSIEEVVETARRICATSGIPKDTPIVVIAERYGVDLEGKDVQVGDREYVIPI